MTTILKVNVDEAASLPVIILDDSDFKTVETGVAFGDVTCKYAKEGDSSLSTFTLDATNWDEIGQGIYEVDFTASELDTLGYFKFVVYGTGYLTYYGLARVVRIDEFSGNGELLCIETGYYKSDGVTFTAWGDDYSGAVTDAETGVAIDDAYVTCYRTSAGSTVWDAHPAAQTMTKVDGKWVLYLDAGTFTFTVHKSGVIDESFNRTLTAT
jgi:hypothetical protein